MESCYPDIFKVPVLIPVSYLCPHYSHVSEGKVLNDILLSSTYVTYIVQLILLRAITIKMPQERYKLWCYAIQNFPHSDVIKKENFSFLFLRI